MIKQKILSLLFLLLAGMAQASDMQMILVLERKGAQQVVFNWQKYTEPDFWRMIRSMHEQFGFQGSSAFVVFEDKVPLAVAARFSEDLQALNYKTFNTFQIDEEMSGKGDSFDHIMDKMKQFWIFSAKRTSAPKK